VFLSLANHYICGTSGPLTVCPSKKTQEGKGTMLEAIPKCLWKNSKSKTSLAESSGYRSCMQTACKQGSFETEKPWGFKKAQLREFWDSQPQCPHERLPPEVEKERFDWGNLKSSKKKLRGEQSHPSRDRNSIN
jgi:hypothetical protein